MKCQKFNNGWKVAKGTPTLMEGLMGGLQYTEVNLPHDAMILEERSETTGNGAQTGFYPGGGYTYVKSLDVPDDWADKTVILEFEGVYETAMVYVNGDFAKSNLYGYTNFYVCLDKYLVYGQTNEIKVVANNYAERNTRWYSGSGIYRDVNLYIGNRIHVKEDGLKITPMDVTADYANVEVATTVSNLTRRREDIQVKTTLIYGDQVVGQDIVGVTMFTEATEEVHQKIGVDSPKLWNVDSPELYKCVVEIISGEEVLDTAEELFGIRTISLDSKHGLRINGESVKLRGSCIHHDNGVIGAATFEDAEERRCRQMKEAGFNSIRSAHHPMSKAMLRACDRNGMLVMDELCDMWTRTKNPNDFARHFEQEMDVLVKRIVDKDYNHPSVILYSAGNEIPDLGSPFGAQMNRHLCNLFHSLDYTRFTTNAINGMLALGDKLGIIIQEFMQAAAQNANPEAGGSSEGAGELNGMMGLMIGPGADAMACHPIMTDTIKEASEAMDIIGLNYLTGRHELEKQLHPNKCVLGTETFPGDIANLWRIVKNNDHVLGDFTWTGYDYLGEAGCGIFYYDGNQNFNGVYPDRLAYIGDINIIGSRRPISYLREIVYGLRKAPFIAVEKVDKYGMQHSQTAWMDKDNIASWTWPGFEGKPAKVDVFSADEEVELFLNGKSLGRKPAGDVNGFRATYELNYEPGILEAIGYTNGKASEKVELKTANDKLHLEIICENDTIDALGERLSFVTGRLVDDEGVIYTYGSKNVKLSISGDGCIQGFGNADPRAIASYTDTCWPTFEGEVMAVIRGTNVGKIKLTFEAENLESKTLEISVK